jgi:hypothetical protein
MKLTDKLLSKEANRRFWEKTTDSGKDSNFRVRWRVKLKKMACGTGYSRPTLAPDRVRAHNAHPRSIPPPVLHLWMVGTRPTHKQMIAKTMVAGATKKMSAMMPETRNVLLRIRSCWPSVRSHD